VPTYIETIIDLAMKDIEAQSKKTLYQTDYLAWASDVLGRKYYSKMAEIAVEVSSAENGKTRTAVKSANGCGKSYLMSDLGVHWITVFPPEESLAIFSANGRDQIERVIFKYLKDAYGYMKTHGHAPVGWINESLEWKYSKPDGSGNEALAFGKRPADQDIVSSFQGTRKPRTFVGFDEMGGLPEDLFTAAEAVTTGGDTRFLGIGNPDRRGTPFHNLFTKKSLAKEWNLHTISAYDLPTMTGEIVYPDEPEKQEAMLSSGMTTRKWIEHKERAWQSEEPDGTLKPNGLFKAKVLGEFPDEGDDNFFPESDVVAAMEREIEPTDYVIAGVDLGFAGEDECVFMVNRGGHCRVFDGDVAFANDAGQLLGRTSGTWNRALPMETARRIHAIAKSIGVNELRVDASGAGIGVYDNLLNVAEFSDRTYTLHGIRGGTSSTDINQWAKTRDEQHDYLRKLLRDGVLDLDPDDSKLKDELMIITYEINDRGAIKITPKRELRNEFGGSPDRLDSLIYATADMDFLSGPQPGDIIGYDEDADLVEDHGFYSGVGNFGW
jgi:hypothetical protein